MEAMILAAGLGTRLRPITDAIPKALVPVRGRPLIAHVMDRVVAAGATRVVVNACHHASQLASWLALHATVDVEVALAEEPDGPYDTGGGLVAARALFRLDGPILLHNVDVLSRIPLEGLLAAHRAARERDPKVLATLGVQARETARRLLFDDEGLIGWERRGSGERGSERREGEVVREQAGALRSWAFSGIHVVEPEIFDATDRTGVFSIRALYLELAARGWRVLPHDVSAHAWQEVGTPERLREAEAGDW